MAGEAKRPTEAELEAADAAIEALIQRLAAVPDQERPTLVSGKFDGPIGTEAGR